MANSVLNEDDKYNNDYEVSNEYNENYEELSEIEEVSVYSKNYEDEQIETAEKVKINLKNGLLLSDKELKELEIVNYNVFFCLL